MEFTKIVRKGREEFDEGWKRGEFSRKRLLAT